MKSFVTKKEDGTVIAGKESFNVTDAILVGLMQFAAALFPGLSRSGSTLAVGEMRGINKQKALDYTFVLGIPSILAAALLETVDAVKAPGGLQFDPIVIIVGMVVSAIVGYIAIIIFKWFLNQIKWKFLLFTRYCRYSFYNYFNNRNEHRCKSLYGRAYCMVIFKNIGSEFLGG